MRKATFAARAVDAFGNSGLADPVDVVEPVAGRGLTYALGLAVIEAPTYAGGAGRELKLRPLWSVRYGRFRLSGARSSGLLGAPTAERGSGASADLVQTDRWSLGLGLRFDNGRQPDDDPALAGRVVCIVPDEGVNGAKAAASWLAALRAAGASVDIFHLPDGHRDLGTIAQNPADYAELISQLFTI
jgi:hypothetical protein